MGKIKKKTVLSIVSIIIFVLVANIGYEKYQEYAHKKELQDKIEYLQSEINSNYDSYSSVDTNVNPVNDVSSLFLSDFSSQSDGTFVKAFGSIKNQLNVPFDEVIDIAFLDENGEIIRVKAMSVQLAGGETKYFEELIGLAKDGTPVPVSAKLTD